MLDVAGATVRFGDTTALDAVDLRVERGQTVALLGPSGSGKTTLLRAIAGLQPLDTGSVAWDGEDLTRTPPHRRHFGLVFQHFALFPHLDVGRNVAFGLRMAGVDATERARQVADALARVELDGMQRRPVSSLSGGQAQRVALARALVVAPRMLLLDEPLGALDRTLRERLALDLRDLLTRLEITAVHVTHDQEEAFTVADTVAILVDGALLQAAPPADVWGAPASETVARFLGLRSIVDADIRAGVATTPVGTFSVPGATDGPARIVIRPEAVDIDDDGPIEAIVGSAVYRGAETTVTFDAGGIALDGITRSRVTRGAGVRLRIDGSAVSVLPRRPLDDAL